MAHSDLNLEIITELPELPSRPIDGNKGSFGKLLIVAGSRGMSGAAVLCGSAALRGGAGLVCLACPEDIQSVIAASNPCYLTIGLPNDCEGRLFQQSIPEIVARAKNVDVLALGPGLGQSPDITVLVREMLSLDGTPLVIDADGLNALVNETHLLHARPSALVLTPHPGEFARLLGIDVAGVQRQRQDLAVQFAGDHRLILVLKGHGTLVTDGQRVYRNMTGNPGMATGGTGDVLTGLIAALLGQGLEPFAAAQMGSYLHGLAGDWARDELGEVSMIASDLLTYLPRAFQTYQDEKKGKTAITGMSG